MNAVMQQQYLPVNWMDGMKINKTHFIAQNNAFTYQMAQGMGSLLNGYNYGLLPNTHNSGNDLKLFVSANNQQQVQIRLQQCRAVTFGGHIIQFDGDTSLHNNQVNTTLPELSVPFEELKGRSSAYYIVLVVNPYERTPYGNASLAEVPMRLPYTLPSCQLQLLPVAEAGKNVLGHFQLPLGRLLVQEQKVLPDEDYIPPCCSVSSHPDLLSLHAELEQFFGKMELLSLQIIQKILQKKQQNDMAAIVQKMCEQIIVFTASVASGFSDIYLCQPPVFLLNTLSSFARLLKNTLDMYTGSGREELINYFMKWCNVSQGELEGAITSLANQAYNHLDINDFLQQISRFARLIAQLFTSLSRLEYIGEKPERGIFVKEQILATEPEVPARQRRSFLAE
jgi:hypothetical protein